MAERSEKSIFFFVDCAVRIFSAVCFVSFTVLEEVKTRLLCGQQQGWPGKNDQVLVVILSGYLMMLFSWNGRDHFCHSQDFQATSKMFLQSSGWKLSGSVLLSCYSIPLAPSFNPAGPKCVPQMDWNGSGCSNTNQESHKSMPTISQKQRKQQYLCPQWIHFYISNTWQNTNQERSTSTPWSTTEILSWPHAQYKFLYRKGCIVDYRLSNLLYLKYKEWWLILRQNWLSMMPDKHQNWFWNKWNKLTLNYWHISKLSPHKAHKMWV